VSPAFLIPGPISPLLSGWLSDLGEAPQVPDSIESQDCPVPLTNQHLEEGRISCFWGFFLIYFFKGAGTGVTRFRFTARTMPPALLFVCF
jgi:hypothetical protein